MDIQSLRDLASQGFAGVSADRLGDLAVWCRDYAEATGDARYSTVGEALRGLTEWWSEHDEYGGIPVDLSKEIERTITALLPDVLDAPTPADAAPIARILRERVEQLLTGVKDWEAEGYVSKRSSEPE